MKKRSPLAVFFLSLITFGIYDLYWLVQTKKVLNEKTRHHTPTIWLLIVPGLVIAVGYGLLFGSIFSSTSSSSAYSSSPTNSSAIVQGGGEHNKVCTITSGATTRYVYVTSNESCPAGTKPLQNDPVTYNDRSNASSTLSNSSSSSSSTSNLSSNEDTADVNGLAVIGWITTMVGFLVWFVISIFWFFRFSKAVNEYTQGRMSTAVSFLILWLVHLIGVALIQDTFNEMEERGGAGSVPASAVSLTASPSTVPPANTSLAPTTPQPTPASIAEPAQQPTTQPTPAAAAPAPHTATDASASESPAVISTSTTIPTASNNRPATYHGHGVVIQPSEPHPGNEKTDS